METRTKEGQKYMDGSREGLYEELCVTDDFWQNRGANSPQIFGKK